MDVVHDPPSSPPTPARPTKIAKMDDAIDISDATTGLAVASSVVSSRATPVPGLVDAPSASHTSGRPDAKARRYDRQLRLWASAGQRSLESARILLVGHDATGCQTLKNLVLPGIQHFTILSDATTTPADVGTNFFLEPSSVGKPIAQEEVRLLSELNPAVTGKGRVENAVELLDKDPNFFLSFTLIITSNIDPSVEDRIAQLLWQTSSTPGQPDIPLMSIRSSGLTGRVQVQLREHCVVDTHPDTTHTLRIGSPFPALEAYARSLDLEHMDSMEHSHIPYVVLLVRAASEWKDKHGSLPSTADEKTEFKKVLNSWRHKSDEENFDEAAAQAYRVWTSSDLPQETADLLEDPAVVTVSKDSKNLHLFLHTLRRFLADPPHLPPVSPTLPDMHSSTQSYIAMQGLYRAQYAADLDRFAGILSSVLAEIHLPADSIPAVEIETFVKNVTGVAIVKGSALSDAKAYKGLISERIADEFAPDSEPTLGLSLTLALQAAESFYATAKRWPTLDDEAEVQRLAAAAVATVHMGEELPARLTNSVGEVLRGGFQTAPTTAAFLGGIAAQEVIKLVTNQYAPLDNTAAVDLVTSAIDKVKL